MNNKRSIDENRLTGGIRLNKLLSSVSLHWKGKWFEANIIIIDAQQELIDGNQKESAVFKKERLIKNINLVIDKAIQLEVPIVFVRDLDVAEVREKASKFMNKLKFQ